MIVSTAYWPLRVCISLQGDVFGVKISANSDKCGANCKCVYCCICFSVFFYLFLGVLLGGL